MPKRLTDKQRAKVRRRQKYKRGELVGNAKITDRERCMITGKVCWPSKAGAYNALLAAREASKDDDNRRECRYYHCYRCGQYHLTSTTWDDQLHRYKELGVDLNDQF